jgi:hypothetical protein
MNFQVNERLKEFFLGDDAAWDDIAQGYRFWLLKRLMARFLDLSQVELEDVIADWFTEKWIKINEERNRAESEGARDNLSAQEIAALKIKYCTERLGFDFVRPIEGWLWTSVRNRAIDSYRKLKPHRNLSIDADEMVEPNDERRDADDIEFQIELIEFKQHLFAALGEDERLYFHIWLAYGGYPPGDVVREVFKKNLQKEIGNTFVTFIKQRFIRICYLTMLRVEYDAGQLKDAFRRSIDADDDDKNLTKKEDAFFDDMMDIIWSVFYADAESRECSRREISRDLWRRREALIQRRNVQNNILVEGYWHFRKVNMRPAFCRTAEIYADNRFGRQVKELFFENRK